MDPLPGGGGGAHAGRQGLDGAALHEGRRCLGRTGEALLLQRGGQVRQGAAGLGQGGAGCVDVLGGVLGLLGPHEERGGAGGDARPGPARLQAAPLVMGEGLALGLQAAAGGLLGGAGGIECGALLLGAGIEGLEALHQLLDAVGCGPRRGQGGGGRLQCLLGGGGIHAVTGALGLLKPGGTGVSLPEGAAECLVGLPLLLLPGLDLLAGGAVGARGGGGGVRGRAAHGAGLALGELTGESPGGPGDPGQAGGAYPFGRLPRERRRLSAGIVPLGELGTELLDGQGRPVTFLGPGTAVLKAVEALVGRARRLQRVHQGGALRGALGELLRALLQLGGGLLQLRLPLLQGAFAPGEAGLEVHQGLELPVLATAVVRQVVEVVGAQCLGVVRLRFIGRHRGLCRVRVLRGRAYFGSAGLRLAGFILEGGELALRLTDQGLDEGGGRHRGTMTVSRAAGGLLHAAGTGDAGLFGQVGQSALVGTGGQCSDGLLGAATGGLLGDQVGPHPGGSFGVLETPGVVGLLLGALSQPLLLLDQCPASLQEVVEALGLLARRLGPGEGRPRGFSPSLGQRDPVAGGIQNLSAVAAKSHQVRGGTRHRRLQGLGRRRSRAGVGLLRLRTAGVIHGQQQRLLGPSGWELLRRVIR